MDDRVKKVLLGGPSGAVDFPSAMARQTIDEAMSELPSQHRQVLKLAYLAGLTNREIAAQLGLTVGGVRRRLRQGLAMIGAYVERGRVTGRRAVHGLAWWLGGRHLDQLIHRSNGPSIDQVLQAGVVVAMAVASTAILITHHTSPAPVSHPHKTPHVAAVGSSSHSVPNVKDKTLAAAAAPKVTSAPLATVVHQATSVATIPIKLQLPELLPVRLPTAPSL
jgi:DNA-binding Lrp family transcriptional regulator